MTKWVISVIAVVMFLAGWWLGRHSVEVHSLSETRVDTVFYEKPEPFRTTQTEVTFNVPRWIFAPGDTDTVERVVFVQDSVQVTLPFERREYKDSTYYAVVSGVAAGGYRPSLEHIETYNTTTTVTTVVRDPYKWEVGPAGGVLLTADNGGVWAGAEARRTFGRLSISGVAGYDFSHQQPVFGVSAGFTLFRK